MWLVITGCSFNEYNSVCNVLSQDSWHWIRWWTTLTVHGGCIQGSPSICMGRAFTVLHTGEEKIKLNTLDYLYCPWTPDEPEHAWNSWQHNAIQNNLFNIFYSLGLFLKLLMRSWYICHPRGGESTQPDGNSGSLCQPVPSTLQTCVDLSHLDDSFQPHHLQTLVAHICGATNQVQPGWFEKSPKM